MPSSDLLLDVIENALQDPTFASSLPPISSEAMQLLKMRTEDKENPRVLALVAQRDPVYTARIMAYANSANYCHHGLTSSIDVALRRIGVTQTYSLLLVCAMTNSFPNLPGIKTCRALLLRYSLSLTLTANKLGDWLELSGAQKTILWLSSLMYCTGIFAGMLYSARILNEFKAGLLTLDAENSLDFASESRLKGFLVLSSAVANNWEISSEVARTLLDASQIKVSTIEGKLLLAVTHLINLETQGENQYDALSGFFEEEIFPIDTALKRRVSLAVVFQ